MDWEPLASKWPSWSISSVLSPGQILFLGILIPSTFFWFHFVLFLTFSSQHGRVYQVALEVFLVGSV